MAFPYTGNHAYGSESLCSLAITACADRFSDNYPAALGLRLLAAEVPEQADQVKSAALMQRGGCDAYANAPGLECSGAILALFGALAMVHHA